MSRSRRPSRALHWKLALAFTGLLSAIAIVLIGGGLRTAERYGRELRQRVNREVARHITKDVRTFTEQGLVLEDLKAVFMHVMHINPTLEVYLLDERGEILAYDAPPGAVLATHVDLAPIHRFLEVAEGELVEGPDPRQPGRETPFSAWPVEQDGDLRGYLYIVIGGEQYESVAALLRGSTILRVAIISALVVLAAAMLVASGLFARLTRPLRRLQDAMGELSGDDLPERVEVRADDDIGDLARAYNLMADRIGEQWDELTASDRQRRELMTGISHDLRTPLSAVRGYLELLDDPESDLRPERRAEYLAAARRGTLQMTRLVDQLFELARLESGDVELHPEEFCPGELVQDVLQQHALRARRRSLRLACRLPEHVPHVHADLGLIERAIANLVANALTYTPADGRVTVWLRHRPGQVEVRVTDTGCGIPAEELERVFERSWRRDRDSGRAGAGLGLAITRRILELHGSEISVSSEVGRGTTFRFSLDTVSETPSRRDRSVTNAPARRTRFVSSADGSR